jgi:hypothetical protein
VIDVEIIVHACSDKGLDSSWTSSIHSFRVMVLPAQALAMSKIPLTRWITPPSIASCHAREVQGNGGRGGMGGSAGRSL